VLSDALGSLGVAIGIGIGACPPGRAKRTKPALGHDTDTDTDTDEGPPLFPFDTPLPRGNISLP